VETLRQNLHPFQAEENARNAAIDKAFSMTGSQNDPLEGVKILNKFATDMYYVYRRNPSVQGFFANPKMYRVRDPPS
jgi:hypothetical protein